MFVKKLINRFWSLTSNKIKNKKVINSENVVSKITLNIWNEKQKKNIKYVQSYLPTQLNIKTIL